MSSTSQEHSPASSSDDLLAERHHRPVGDERHVGAFAREPRLAELDHVLAFGNLAAHRAVVELRLEEHDGIVGANRRREQPLRVGRRRRDRDLHAGRVHVVRLGRVVVQLRRAHAAAVGHAHRDREPHLPTGPPPVAPDVRDQLVERRIREGVVLHLAHRSPAGHAEPDRGAHDPGLRERRVEAAIRPEPIAQTRCRTEDAAGATDVLAQDHHVRVTPELDVEAVVDRFEERELSHRAASGAPRRTRAAVRRARGRTRATRRRAPRPRPR